MSDKARELMRLADAPQHCADCPMFAVVRDAVTLALLKGGLGQVLTGQPIRVPEALPSPAPSGGHHVIARGGSGQAERDPLERLAKVRASLYGRLAAIDNARREITRAARFGDVPTAVWTEVLHHTATIAKETQRAREVLAGTALRK